MGRFLSLGTGLALAMFAQGAASQVSAVVSTLVGDDIGPNREQTGPQRAQADSSQGDSTNGVTGHVEAANGFMRFSGSAHATITDPSEPFSVAAVASGRFEDTLTFGGTAAGTEFRVRYSFFTEGNLGATCTGDTSSNSPCAFSEWNAAFTLNGRLHEVRQEVTQAPSGFVTNISRVDNVEVADPPLGLFTFETSVTADTPVTLVGNALGSVRAGMTQNQVPSTGSSFFDFTQSVYWAGIESVTLVDGTPVDYTLSSASGTDYRGSLAPTPIPEPSTWVLMLGGVVALSALKRRDVQGRNSRPPKATSQSSC